MKIYGNRYRFRLTVGASAKIARLCPQNSLKNLPDLLNKGYPEMVETTAKMAAIMNEAQQRAELFEVGVRQKEQSIVPLTEEMVLSLSDEQFAQLQREVFAAYRGDMKTEVDTEPVQKKTEEGQHEES